MKKFRVTFEPSPFLKEEHHQVYPPSVMIPTGTTLDLPPTLIWTPLDQPSTSTDDLQATMAQIKSVWETRMNAHITDKLAEHDSVIAKEFADQDKKSASKFNVLEKSLRARFDDLETALKSKVDLLESNLIVKLDATETTMIAKVDVMETKLIAMVNPNLSDLDSDFKQ